MTPSLKSRPESILDHLRKYLAALGIGGLMIGSLAGSLFAGDSALPAKGQPKPAAVASHLPVLPQMESGPLSHAEVYARTVRSTVMLYCPQKGGQLVSTGSGVILDKARGLVLTNHHVIGSAVNVNVYLADMKEGDVISEPSHYEKVKPIPGRVIDSDPSRDLALVQLDGLPEEATQVPVAAHGARTGDTVLSIGNPQKARALWVLTVGMVRGISRRTIIYQDGQTIDAKIALTDSMTNPGDSGGPVVNQRGELVALVSGKATEADALTFFIDLSEVNHFVEATESLVNATTAEELAARAEHFAGKKKFELAHADLTAALKLDPDNVQLLGRRGEISMELNKLDDAIVDLTEAIDAGSPPASVLAARGWCHLWKNDVDSARDDFSAAITADRKFVKAYHGRGLVHMRGNKFALAVADFSRATKLEPTNCTYFNERGHAFYAQENWEKALADYTEAARLAPQDGVLHANKALVLQKLNRNEEAVAVYSEAIKTNGNNAQWINSRGVVHFAMSNFEAAVADFTAAINLEKNNATFWNNRGNSYGRLGQMDKAKADYAEGLRLDPKSGPSQEFAARIAEANRPPMNRRQPQPQPRPAPAPAPIPPGAEPVDEEPIADENPIDNDGGNENQPQPITSQTALPKEIVGGWVARVQTPNGPRYLKMVLGVQGQYVAVLTDAAGNMLSQDAGTARMENGDLVCKSMTGGVERSQIQFRGGKMIATVRQSANAGAAGLTLEFSRM